MYKSVSEVQHWCWVMSSGSQSFLYRPSFVYGRIVMLKQERDKHKLLKQRLKYSYYLKCCCMIIWDYRVQNQYTQVLTGRSTVIETLHQIPVLWEGEGLNKWIQGSDKRTYHQWYWSVGAAKCGSTVICQVWQPYTNQNQSELWGRDERKRRRAEQENESGISMERRGQRGNNAAAARERGWTCCLAAGVVIDEVTERASPKCRVSSEGHSGVG